MFMSLAGGLAAGVAPEFHYNLIGERICPPGSTTGYTTEEVEDPEGGSSALTTLHCYDGEGNDLAGPSTQLRATALIWGGYFALCFIPLFLGPVLFGSPLRALAGRLFRRGGQGEGAA
jgi:hypothetical protein